MKTSEVAQRADLPISTLRYYEKIGLITEEYVLREENNYRNYVPEIITYLKDEQTLIITAKIAEIEDAQKNLEASKQSLYQLLKMDITCEDGFGKH
ncbi:MerR family DNA-binding transcriptional regulator [Paenibacillus sp. FSL R7-0204]|uniref:MerR family DNA-binding transcriptional regulator n=1 Tax=Paenibacillus sp. FSL R7-0204 TaxID=2921675 RepID=UPI0030FA922A